MNAKRGARGEGPSGRGYKSRRAQSPLTLVVNKEKNFAVFMFVNSLAHRDARVLILTWVDCEQDMLSKRLFVVFL